MHHEPDLLAPTLLGTCAQWLHDWEWLALTFLYLLYPALLPFVQTRHYGKIMAVLPFLLSLALDWVVGGRFSESAAILQEK